MNQDATSSAHESVDLTALLEGHDEIRMNEVRMQRLRKAIELGASREALEALRDANRTSTLATIILPANRLEHLSRGRGWARKGRGDSAEWGARCSAGYRVGPGRWSVGATDGFSRKRSDDWDVFHVQVGPETWTVAS